ncbi:MAG: hypothetical protein LBH20_03610 [Treponema sp.]|nr:hypothetical protein [Treponema sp.]
MKKSILIFVFLLIVSMSVSAQGVYFDIGVGGGPNFFINGIGSAFDGGFKVGYGPFGNIPLYVIGESNFFIGTSDGGDGGGAVGIGIGPGFIYYPIQFIQVGAALGVSLGYWGNIGFCWNASIAYDFGKGKHGLLIGLNFIGARYNYIPYSWESVIEEINCSLGVFVKYAYKEKI